MKDISLTGKRVLITQADDFMGPALCKTFKALGAEVLADRTQLTLPGNTPRVIADNGRIDALVLNLAVPAPNTLAHQVETDEWEDVFAAPTREETTAISDMAKTPLIMMRTTRSNISMVETALRSQHACGFGVEERRSIAAAEPPAL